MTDGKTVDVIGAGGHAKVVVATVQAAGLIVRAVWDDDQSRWGERCWACRFRDQSPPCPTVPRSSLPWDPTKRGKRL